MAALLRRSTLLGSGVTGLALLWYTSRSGNTEKKNIVYCNSVSEFSNKSVLITGAAGDIGYATARAFAKRSANLILVDLPHAQSKMKEDGQQLLKEGAGSITVLSADMTKVDEVERMVSDAVKLRGNIDCFFNNAGIQGEFKPLHEQSVEKFQQTLQVNILGVFLGMKYVSLAMIKEKKGGVIVNTSSVAGVIGPPNMAAYAASKFAVSGLTRTGAKDLARYGIRVCAVAPGLLQGRMWMTQVKGQAKVLKELEGIPGDVDEDDVKRQEEKMIKSVPLQRIGKLSEVAEVVVFLCSDSSSYISGEIITIDGGKRA